MILLRNTSKAPEYTYGYAFSSGRPAQAASYTPGVAEKRNGSTKWNHGGLRDFSDQTSASGSIAAAKESDSYGLDVSSSGSFQGPFGFCGPFGYDSGDGNLLLVGHRWYDAEVGRFVTRDPSHDGSNWNRYCENNPLKYVDPNGEQAQAIIYGAALADPEPVTKTVLIAAAIVITVGTVIAGTDDYIQRNHRNKKRRSTKEGHERGEAREQRDKPGGERGDVSRNQKRSKRPRHQVVPVPPDPRNDNKTSDESNRDQQPGSLAAGSRPGSPRYN